MHDVTMWQTFMFIFVNKKKQKQKQKTDKQKQKTSKFRVKVDEEKDDAMCRPQLHVMLLINLLGGWKYKNYNMTYTYVGLCIIKTEKFQFFAIWVENEGLH